MRSEKSQVVSVCVGLSALAVVTCLLILYIGRNMGPPRWPENVAVWMVEKDIHGRDFYRRLCRMEELSDAEIGLCATSGCIAAKCLVVQNPTVSIRWKEVIYRRAIRKERCELRRADRDGDLDGVVHEKDEAVFFERVQEWLQKSF